MDSSEKRFCTKCGRIAVADADFCSGCGTSFAKEERAPSPQPTLTKSNAANPTPLKKDDNSSTAAGCGCLIVILIIIGIIASCSSHSSNNTTSPDTSTGTVQDSATDAPTEKPQPTPTPESYEHQHRREKQEFLSSVDESISGAMIADNKFKYVGKKVDIHCTVSDIPDRNFFNANCGDEDNIALVVIQYDASGLSTGQTIRVIGTVEEPMQGNNVMGGSMQFPTVKAEFME